MAEFASGAVNSLLSVLRDEARLLGRVEGDLKFIQEEMESMNSFLQHLDRTTPSGRDHEEQVRTWMKQVRDLAYDCSNFIDLHLLRGDPAVYRATGPVRRYLWLLVPWYLQKLYVQHRAAIQLRELKARARDVGKRRLRYDVKIPEKSGKKDTTTTLAPITGAASSSQAAGKGDTGEEEDDDDSRARRHSDDRRALAFSEPRILEECTQKLLDWLSYIEFIAWWINKVGRFPSIAIAAPDEEDGADVAREALAHPSVAAKFEHVLWITSEWFWRPGPLDILEEILREVVRQAVRTRGDVKIPEKSGGNGEPSGREATSSSYQGTIPSDDKQILGELLPESREGEWAKTKELDKKIEEIVNKTKEHLQAAGTKWSLRVVPLEPLDILCDIFAVQIEEKINETAMKDQIEEKINDTAMKIKEHLELDKTRSWIGLDDSDYVGILRELLPRPKEDKPVKRTTDKLGDDQIAENIREITNKIKVDILRELQEDKSVKEDMDRSGEDHIEEKIKEATEKIIVNMLREMLPKPKEDMDKLDGDQKIEDITEKIKRILENIKEHLLVKEIAKKIKEHLEGKKTIIVLEGIDNVQRWEVTKWALSKLGCAAGSGVIVTTDYTKGASQYCNPTRKPIEYSLVGFYHYKAIRLTSPFVNEDYYDASILHAILKNCEPHELCMKLFVRALYANPKRSNGELEKLRDTLDFRGQLETNARKMIKFSYSDLPRDYKTCFLYLAIFPQGHKIKRSTLVGRWVAEGLVTEEDWTHSVHRAERCFDELVDRWLVYPGDIGVAGKVKSCIAHDIVHEFITKIARKEHFVDTRLSHHLARHFSVRSDVRLRSSEDMPKFLRKLHTSPQYPLVKVLDLESCQCFEKNYLKNICNKMLLLKYLSLRNTDITKLPKEINNLHQLEVLDIRQTKVRAHATKHVLLLKLKRLLAGPIDLIPISSDTGTVRAEESFSSVQIPGGIEKMTNMEVLSHVKASRAGHELKQIGKLWQLRKLGVVIKDKNDHLGNLLQAISDLNECLQSLSITLPGSEGTPCNVDLPRAISDLLRRPLKLLESLSISGITHSGQLLPTLVKYCDQLAKVTLHDTHMNKDNMKDLGQLAKLRCVRLRHESYTETNLTFKEDEFKNLKYFLVEGSNMTEISFENGAAPELQKIVLSSTNMNNISFEDKAAPKLEKIVFSSTSITSISFGNRAAPKLVEIALPSTNITSITFKNGAAPNLRKTVLSYTNIECLSRIDKLIGLKEIELNGRGITSAALLSLVTNANQIAKVTLRDTLLRQGDLQILAKQPNIRCLILLEKSFDERQLTFNKDEFPKLNLLIVKCPDITNISFTDGAAPKLEKIVWSFTKMESLSGIDNLLELKELELNGDLVPVRVRQAIKAHPNNPDFKHNKPQNEDKEKGSAAEADDTARFPFFWKNWGRC